MKSKESKVSTKVVSLRLPYDKYANIILECEAKGITITEFFERKIAIKDYAGDGTRTKYGPKIVVPIKKEKIMKIKFWKGFILGFFIGAIVLLFSTKCYSQEFEGGFIKVIGSGGTPPYTFSLDGSPYQTKDTFFNVFAGQHTINTMDSKKCIKPIVCTMYDKISMVVLKNTKSSVTFQASGGKPPYYFSKNSTTNWTLNKTTWNGLQRNRVYIFRVKDSLGYIYYINVTL